MKAFLLAVIVAIGMGVGAAALLETQQKPADAAFSTGGVRR
jgi:hypothetical protein